MKRAEILKKLEGVENADEIVDFIMSENGKDIEKSKVDTSSYEEKITKLQEDLKKFEEGGEKFVDAEELNRLKKFETDTLEKQTFEQKNNAVVDWLKENKASEKALKLLAKTVDYKTVEVENGKVKNADTIFANLKTDYKDFFVEEQQGGATPSTPPTSKESGEKQPNTLAEAIAQKYDTK